MPNDVAHKKVYLYFLPFVQKGGGGKGRKLMTMLSSECGQQFVFLFACSVSFGQEG
jgi:hypothetical protein